MPHWQVDISFGAKLVFIDWTTDCMHGFELHIDITTKFDSDTSLYILLIFFFFTFPN